MKYDGVIADFQGDAALGFWGWPVAPDEGVLPACQTALEIHEGFCQARTSPGHPLADFKIGIGLANGRAIAGRIGSDEQAKLGVFGPVVNLGSRLEGMTKQFGVPILMDEACAAQARAELSPREGRCRRLGQFCPYGMQTAAAVSELLPPHGARSNLTDRNIGDFEDAVDCVAAGNWRRARALFEHVPEDDGPRNFYLDLLTRYDDQPPEPWNGVISLTSK
jgi:adenylate cyclase